MPNQTTAAAAGSTPKIVRTNKHVNNATKGTSSLTPPTHEDNASDNIIHTTITTNGRKSAQIGAKDFSGIHKRSSMSEFSPNRAILLDTKAIRF
jgi:hypothetical protein